MISLAVLMVLLMSNASSAWHWNDEESSTFLESRAGDPRILDDGADCFEATREKVNATCAVLYAHIFSAPFKDRTKTMNLIRPADCLDNRGIGFYSDPAVYHSESQAQVVIQAEPPRDKSRFCRDPSIHTMGAFTSPPVILDPQTNITGYWYLSANTLDFSLGLTGNEGPLPATGVLPCVTVEMVLTSTTDHGETMELGRGALTKTVVSGLTSEQVETPVPDACPGAEETLVIENITEFAIDLGRVPPALQTADSLQWHVSWYHETPDILGGSKIRHVQWNVHTGPDHPPRLVVPVQDPFNVWDLLIRPGNPSDLRFDLDLWSPWGHYDTDRGSIRLVLHDEKGQRVELNHFGGSLYDDHGLLTVIRGWNVHDENIAPGNYELTLASTNWQHTMDANWTAVMEVTEDDITLRTHDGSVLQIYKPSMDEQNIPAPGVLIVILVVLYGFFNRVVFQPPPSRDSE